MDDGKRIDRLEERVNKANAEIASLKAQLTSTNADLSRRITEININLKEDGEKMRIDMRERLDTLKDDLSGDMLDIKTSLNVLSVNIADVSTSVQNLYVSQEGSSTQIKINEKIIWVVIGIIGSVGLYLLKAYLKT